MKHVYLERVVGDQRGQSTVEAAALLVVIMLLLAMLVQPVCLLLTKTIMNHAAAETVRVLQTSEDEDVARAFALRRLAAVPPASLFHVGGDQDWTIVIERSDDGREVTVDIRGHARPLPLLGATTSLMGMSDESGVLLWARQTANVRQDWLRGDYEDWMAMWR